MKYGDNTSVAAWLLLGMITIIYAAMSWLTPLQLDDLIFSSAYQELAGGTAPNLKGFVNYFLELRMNDNSRLSNELFPLFLLWPGTTWVFHALTGIMMGGIILMICRIATGSWRPRTGWVLATWAWLLLALPWRNYIFVADYTLNYIFSSAIMLAWALLMVKLAVSAQRFRGVMPWCGIVLFSTIAAGWHEGFVGPMWVGLVVLAWRMRVADTRYWALMAWTAIIMVIFAFSPGMIDRAGREVVGSESERSIPMLIVNTWLVSVTCAIVVAALLSRRGRKLLMWALSDQWILLMSVTTVCACGVCLLVKTSPRISFWPELTMLVAWQRFAYLKRWRIKGLKSYLVGSIVLILILIQSAMSLYWQRIYKLEHDKIISRVEAGENTVYYDVILPAAVPKATLYMPARIEFNDRFGLQCIGEYYHRQNFAVVPTVLDGDITTGRKVGDGIYEYCGELALDHEIVTRPYVSITAHVALNDGTERELIYDGTTYADPSGALRVWLKARTGLLISRPPAATDIVNIEIIDIAN